MTFSLSNISNKMISLFFTEYMTGSVGNLCGRGSKQWTAPIWPLVYQAFLSILWYHLIGCVYTGKIVGNRVYSPHLILKMY